MKPFNRPLADPIFCDHGCDNRGNLSCQLIMENTVTPAVTDILVETKTSRKTIRDLPTELLFDIFSLVHHDLYGSFLPPDRDQSQRDQWVTFCSTFPYAIASICPVWRDVMLSVPEFWANLVILVDPPATSLSAIASYLSWSSGQPFNVTITRRWGSVDPIDGQHERARIIAILNVLSSHLHLIQELHFDVTFSSSLPLFPTDFHGSATILKRLELRCREEDGGPKTNTPVALSITEHQEFECPKLTTLVIDGRNYYEACRRDRRWTDNISSVMSMTISHFKRRPGESFSSYDLLLPLTAIDMETLHITNVILDPSPDGLHIPNLPLTPYLVFEDMHDTRIMDQIIHLVHSWQIKFVRCTFGGIADTFRRFGDTDVGGVLVLEAIDQDIAPILRLWDANHLHIERCPSFDDAILDAMSSEENGTFACATYVRTLTITDCSNSIAALRRFIQSRLHLPPVNDHDEWLPTATRIQHIYFYGNIPPISEVDRAWFAANVPRFM